MQTVRLVATSCQKFSAAVRYWEYSGANGASGAAENDGTSPIRSMPMNLGTWVLACLPSRKVSLSVCMPLSIVLWVYFLAAARYLGSYVAHFFDDC